jgi:hypothetical protein
MPAPQYKAKQMKPVDIRALGHSTDTMPQSKAVTTDKTKPSHMPKKGENPKASMYDGPYGGKKPQS